VGRTQKTGNQGNCRHQVTVIGCIANGGCTGNAAVLQLPANLRLSRRFRCTFAGKLRSIAFQSKTWSTYLIGRDGRRHEQDARLAEFPSHANG
jgi:hypothetical protein